MIRILTEKDLKSSSVIPRDVTDIQIYEKYSISRMEVYQCSFIAEKIDKNNYRVLKSRFLIKEKIISKRETLKIALRDFKQTQETHI